MQMKIVISKSICNSSSKINRKQETHTHICIFTYIKVKFSLATTPRYRGGRNSFPWITPFYPWSLPYNAECLVRWCQVLFFESFVWLDLGLNPGLPGHWQILIFNFGNIFN